MTAQLAPLSVQRFYDNNGNPLFNGQLFSYAAGTSTPQATYVDSTQTTQNTNPVILNFRGECNLWLDPTKAYKLVLQDQFNNLIWTVDNIQGVLNPTSNLIPNADNVFTLGSSSNSWANIYVGANHAPVLDTVSGNIGYYARTAAEIAAGVTPVNYAYPPGDVRRYGGAPGASTAVNNAAIAAAILICGTHPIYFCAGTWAYSNEPWFQSSNVHVYGDGIGKTILQPVGWIDGLRFADSTYPNAAVVLTHITVRNLTIDGTNQTAGANDTNGNGVNFNGIDYIDCHDVECRSVANQSIVSTYYNVGGYGVQQSVKIVGNIIRMIAGANTCGIGIEGQSSFNMVANNVITNCQNEGILIANYGGSAVTNGRNVVIGNIVQGPTSASTLGIILNDITFHNIVEGNFVDGFNISIGVYSFAGVGSVFDVLVAGNYCKDFTTNAVLVAPKSGDASNTHVTGNLAISTVASGSSRTLSLDKGASASANRIFSGNTGIFCLAGGGQRLTGNVVTGPATSFDMSSAGAAGVIGQGNLYDGALLLNSDTIWDYLVGYGGTVASAATLTIPQVGTFFQVTGTTNIVSIAASGPATEITLQFAGILTVTNGSNIRLNGNFTTVAGSTLRIARLGPTSNSWYETSRTP